MSAILFAVATTAAVTCSSGSSIPIDHAASDIWGSRADAEIYVSPNGDDHGGDGTHARPFATLPRAQIAARRALAAQATAGGNVTVHVGAGRYYQHRPLVFSSLDSGRNGGRMRWIGPGPEAGVDPISAAVVYGGVRVTGWRKVGDGPVWAANVSTLGGSAKVSKPFRRFFNLVEGQRGAILARHPDFGSGYLKDVGCTNNATMLQCPPGVLPRDLSVADTSVFANVGGNWFSATLSATSMTSDAAGHVNVSFQEGGGAYKANNKIYLQGAHQLISEPGEWGLDSEAVPPTVYYWPRDASAMEMGGAHIVSSSGALFMRLLRFHACRHPSK